MNKVKRSLSLILVMILTATLLINPSKSFAGEEKSNLVDISQINILVNKGAGFYYIIKDGEIQEGADNPTVGNTIQFEYKWGISKDNLASFSPGDYFLFDLPEKYFKFDNTQEFDLETSTSPKEKLGTYQVIDGKIKITLSEIALSKDSLQNGFVNATGKITDFGEDIIIEGGDGVVLPPITIIDPGGGTGGAEFDHSNNLPIDKGGAQKPGANSLIWNILINYDNQLKRFNGEEYNDLKNAFFTDTLEGPQTFSSMKIQKVYYTATSEGRMSNHAFKYDDANPTADGGKQFKEIIPTTEETVEEFKATMKSYGKPAYGIFKNEVVVYFGGILPSSDILMHNDLKKNNYEEIDRILKGQLSENKITKTGYEKTMEHYRTGTEDELISFQITINTDVDIDSDPESFLNKAKLTHEDGVEESEEHEVKFQKVGGGAEVIEPKSIKIKKADDAKNVLEGVSFKLTKLNETSGSFEDYTAPDGGSLERETNDKGEVEFKKLHTGKYKIVETKGLIGYENPIYSPGDEFEIKDSDTKGIIFKVINPIQRTKVEGNKLWDDGNDQDGKRPTSIKIDLYKKVGEGSPTKVDEVEVTPDAQGNWKYNFTGLPKYEGGELITYSVKEQQILDYTSKVEGFDITNSYTPGETQISVIKTWNDSENQDGKRPTSITVDLYKTVDGVETKLETQTLNELNSWSYQWTELPVKEAGKTITYTVKEANLPEGYTTSQKTENGTVTITNSYTPEETEVKGNKLWDDANDQDGKRPSSIAVELYKTVEDQTTKVDEVEVIPDANGDWKYNFKNLPKYADGEEILYSVKEQVVEDYTSKIKDFNITNSYTPGKTEIEVIKNWNDKNDQDKIRPTSIKVELYARESGTDKEGNLVDTVKLSDKNNWSHKWTDLDTHKDKKELEYYVVEKEVSKGYEVTYKVNSATRTVFITNSHTPVDPPTPEEPGKPWLPKTGITGIAGLGILGMSLVGLGAVQFKKKK